MNTILVVGIVIILALAGLGVYLGWAAYHEKAKKVVRDVEAGVLTCKNTILVEKV